MDSGLSSSDHIRKEVAHCVRNAGGKIAQCARIALVTGGDTRHQEGDDSRIARAMRSVQQHPDRVWPRNAPNGPDKRRHGTSCISDAWGVKTEPRRRSEGHLPPAFWIGESTSATRERGSLRGD